ncbi:uncharacterized protein ACNS7B_012970 [Menidia menidia]
MSVSTRHEEHKKQHHTHTASTVLRPYNSDPRHPPFAKSAKEASLAMELEVKINKDEAENRRKSVRGKLVTDKERLIKHSLKKTVVLQSNMRDNESSGVQSSPPPPEFTRQSCEDKVDAKSVSVSSLSTDDGLVSLPGVQNRATDSSSASSVSDTNEENKIPHSSYDSKTVSEKDSQISKVGDLPQPLQNSAGTPLCPTEPLALGKVRGMSEVPHIFHPNDTLADTLARATSTLVQTPIQIEAPQTHSKPDASPMWQQAYDLLADFPALQPPEKPLALNELRHGNPKTKTVEVKRGLTHSPNHCQDSGVSRERRVENVPHEVSSICSGDQKPAQSLQTFGSVRQCNSPTISCEKTKASNQPRPEVAGTDGVGVNARSWASAAKAGMRQAAALQEKARPRIFKEIVTATRTKAQMLANKVAISHHGANVKRPALCRNHQPPNPNLSDRPKYHSAKQGFGSQGHQSSCPLEIR